jgi:hypothetical protein
MQGRRFSRIVVLLLAGAGFAACSSKSGSTDAGANRPDAPTDKGKGATTEAGGDTTTTGAGGDAGTDVGADAATGEDGADAARAETGGADGATADAGAEVGSDATMPTSCLNGSTWTQTQTAINMCACTSSSWKFTANTGGGWDVAETGCASGTGSATFDGTNVVLTFVYTGGAGVYTFPLNACAGGAGTVHWTSGPCNGTTLTSTWAKQN